MHRFATIIPVISLERDKPESVEHVYKRACQTKTNSVIIASPDRAIVSHFSAMGMHVHLVSPLHKTDPQRCAEVLFWLSGADMIVCWPASSIDVLPEWVDGLVDRMKRQNWDIATLVAVSDGSDDVKIVVHDSECVWFGYKIWKHLGVWVFDCLVLRSLATLDACNHLGQCGPIAWAQNEYRIFCLDVEELSCNRTSTSDGNTANGNMHQSSLAKQHPDVTPGSA